jgi:hypothetical protein
MSWEESTLQKNIYTPFPIGELEENLFCGSISEYFSWVVVHPILYIFNIFICR